MKYKLLSIIGFAATLIISLVPVNVFAGSATVYVSPSSASVTKGGNVTVSVRVNSGSGLMDSAQASLNFDTSKMQYVSYSAGAFTTTIQGGVSGGTFSYAGAILGSTLTSDKLMFSVTFKSLVAGSASLSLSGVNVAYQGVGLTPISTSGGTVTINNPVVVDDTPDTTTPTTTPTTTTPTTTPTTTTPTETKDTVAPKISAKPTVAVTKNTINLKFNTNEKSKIQIKYTIGKESKTISDNTLKTAHDLTVGSDQVLAAGSTYKVEIIATDSAGNKATINSQNIRTTGVDYSVQITDLDGNPLANHAVQLFSDPMDATTDENGFATFNDVTPGEHTLVFDIDGLVLRQSVAVAEEVIQVDAENADSTDASTVKLPVKFATVGSEKLSNSINYIGLAVAAAIFGAVIATLARLRPVKIVFLWIWRAIGNVFGGIFKNKKPKPFQD